MIDLKINIYKEENMAGIHLELSGAAGNAGVSYTFAANSTGVTFLLSDMFDAAAIAANTTFNIIVPAGITLDGVGKPVFDFTAVSGKTINITNNGTIKAGTGAGVNYYLYGNVKSVGYSAVSQPGYSDPFNPVVRTYIALYCMCGGWGIPSQFTDIAYSETYTAIYSSAGCWNVNWVLDSTTGGTVVNAITAGSNTINIAGTTVVGGVTSASNYYSLNFAAGCNCDCNCTGN